MEKKYPGTYKRHLVRPIVRSNAVEKLIKKKGSMSHKPGMPPAKRFEAQQLLTVKEKITISCSGCATLTLNVHLDGISPALSFELTDLSDELLQKFGEFDIQS